jgi:predicted TIM-barrel fold metal-dependent hydrolase
MDKAYRIDVHNHIVPQEYVSSLAEKGITSSGGFPFPDWSPEATIARMDEQGIAVAMTSISAPGVYIGDIGFARELALVEFIFDTTRAVTNLILNGTLERYPDISIILSHAGGAIPCIAGRIALAETNPFLKEIAPKGVIAYLKDLYYDTALSATPYALPCLRTLADPSHIVFGSDYPFAPESELWMGKSAEQLNRYGNFDNEELLAVERNNALRLFPRLRNQL